MQKSQSKISKTAGNDFLTSQRLRGTLDTMKKIPATLVALVAFPTLALAGLQWSPASISSNSAGFDDIFDAEFRTVSCEKKEEAISSCTSQIDPTTQKDCTGAFHVLTKIKGDIETGKYLNIPFMTIGKVNAACLPDKKQHLFFREGDRIRIFKKADGSNWFRFLDDEINNSLLRLPDFTRAPQVKTFPDLESGSQAEQLFNYFFWRGVVSGFADGTARADREVSRASFLTIVTRIKVLEDKAAKIKNEIMTKSKGNNVIFSDVLKSDWFAAPVALGWDRDWLDGFANNEFRPGEGVTFAQALKIAFNAFDVPIVQTASPTWHEKFMRTAQGVADLQMFTAGTKLTRLQTLQLINAVERESLRLAAE